MEHKMFCFQCEQTAGCSGCTGNAGVCGKSRATAALQDELTGALIGLAKACGNNPHTEDTTHILIEGLFTTITNVNFNDETLREMIAKVHAEKERVVPNCATCASPCGNTSDYDMKEIWEADEDIRSLKSLILFGIRGMAAYAYHAAVLGYEDETVNAFFYKALSFLGFDGMSTLAEETHEPEKNIGKGIIIALSIIIVVFVAQTYIAAIVQPDWAATDPDMGFFDSVYLVGGPVFYKIMLLVNIVAVGIANIINAQMASSRLLYSMGRDGVIPRVFGKVHPKFQTPWFASIFLGAITLCLALPLQDYMGTLAGFVNFGALSSFILLNFAVFWFFFVKEKKRASFKDILMYLICPFIGIAILGYVFTGFEWATYAVGVTWLVIGLIIGAVKSKGYKEVPEAFKNLEV